MNKNKMSNMTQENIKNIEQKEQIEKEIIEMIKQYIEEILRLADNGEIDYIEIVGDISYTYFRINNLKIEVNKKEKTITVIKNDEVIKEYEEVADPYVIDTIEELLFNDLDYSVHAIAADRAEKQFKQLFNLSDDDIKDVEIRDFDIIIRYYDKKEDIMRIAKTNYYKAMYRSIYNNILVKVKINFYEDDFEIDEE
ncbi:MAG: hypothetical protein QXD25_01945 [Nanopusillaceae archaeon]